MQMQNEKYPEWLNEEGSHSIPRVPLRNSSALRIR